MINQPINRPYPRPAVQPANVQPAKYAGSYTDRRHKHNLRADRRWGDWSILEVSTPLLWLEADAVLDAEIVDLWA